MCRVAYIQGKDPSVQYLEELFKDLNLEAGGDGLGIGWFEEGQPQIFKNEKITTAEMAGEVFSINSDNGILFHCRRASVGLINDVNCHPYTYGNTITIHNGHVEGFGVLKLMMVENLEKYSSDGWTLEKIISTTDSDILSYFIWKRGFGIVPMMASGTVMTLYPDHMQCFVGYCLQAIEVKGTRIYASSFSDEMGMLADQWVVFYKGSEIKITHDGVCTFISGGCYNAKVAWAEEQKKKKKGKKGKFVEINLVK